MRILQLCTDFMPGGIQKHVIELSESLRHKGHCVFLGGSPGPWMNQGIDDAFFSLDLLTVSTEEKRVPVRAMFAARHAARLRSFLKSERIELIHAHESAPAIVAKLAGLGLKIPIVVTYHGSEPGRVKYFGKVARLSAQVVITLSHRCAKQLHEQAGVPDDRMRVIGLGVRPPPLIAQPRILELRNKHLGSDGRVLVVVIARLVYQKGIDVLVDVVRCVARQRRDIRFVVVGDGPLRDEAVRWTRATGVRRLIHFVGETDEPYLYLKAADLFLLTSRWEALPITIAEAFQAAVPVIATDTGGVAELVSDSVGRVVPVGDVDGLAASVLEICADKDARERMMSAALTLSREDRFSIPHIHGAIERMYAETIGVPSPCGALD